ncbi:MAG: hypothetical protein KC933_29640, partial [Myxococcales bacterium]|nr:hypothetical protein [Myxococcales bacterium]
MLRRRGALSVAALSIFFLAACRSPEPLSARLAGCQDMDASGRCFAEPGAPLTVLADGALTVRVDGALAEATFPAPDHP